VANRIKAQIYVPVTMLKSPTTTHKNGADILYKQNEAFIIKITGLQNKLLSFTTKKFAWHTPTYIHHAHPRQEARETKTAAARAWRLCRNALCVPQQTAWQDFYCTARTRSAS
jgi:hypothetical protein